MFPHLVQPLDPQVVGHDYQRRLQAEFRLLTWLPFLACRINGLTSEGLVSCQQSCLILHALPQGSRDGGACEKRVKKLKNSAILVFLYPLDTKVPERSAWEK